MTFFQTLDSKIYAWDLCIILFVFLHIHSAKHQFHGLRHYFVFLATVIIGRKIEKKKSKWCVLRFVVYLEFSRIKRLAWRNLSRKSNISSNDNSSIHYPILYSYAAGGRNWNWPANLCLFSIFVSFYSRGMAALFI